MPLVERQDSELPWFDSYRRRRNDGVDEADEWQQVGTDIPSVGKKDTARDELNRLVFLQDSVSDRVI